MSRWPRTLGSCRRGLCGMEVALMANEVLRLKGLIAAPHTVMNRDGSVALDAVGAQVGNLLAQGVSGAFVCGTTGEGYALTTAERKLVAERWVKLAAGRLPVVVHVGHQSVADACELAAHAREIGADAIAACPPSFMKPGGVEEAMRGCEAVARAASGVPFYYYHIPSLSGVRLDVSALVSAGRERIECFGGVKFTEPDLYAYQRALAAAEGEVDVLWGVDEMLLGALAVGAVGAVGSTYNYMAGTYLKMIDAFEKGELEAARERASESVQVVDLLNRWGGMRTGKALMGLQGIDAGPVRLPLLPLDDGEREEILLAARGILG